MRLAAHPSVSIPQACGGWAETRGAYRWLGHEDVHGISLRRARTLAERAHGNRT
jgi:hypothetical protein